MINFTFSALRGLLIHSKPARSLTRSFASNNETAYHRQKFKVTRRPPGPPFTTGRTYQEELYSARRFTNVQENNGSSLVGRLNFVMRDEGIVDEVRARRQFVKPAKKRILALFKSRQGRFNAMLKETLHKDAHAFAYDFAGVKNQGLFAVFDGHGGKTAAKWAATHFSEVLERLVKERLEDDMMEVMAEAFKQIDAQMTAENKIFSGCTAVVCFLRKELIDGVEKDLLLTANVGDARAVLFRNKTALRLSHDHKASDPLEQKRVRSSGGFVSNDRVNGILAVTRSLGDHELKEYVIGQPYTSRTILDSDDTVLVLACDGVWDVLEDQQVCEMADGFSDPVEAARKITERAIDEGSSDNISTMVVYLQRRRPAQ